MISYGMALHEVFMAGDQIQNAGLFFRAAKALEGDVADMAGKFFEKDQLQNFWVSGFQMNGTFNPKFDIVIDSKPSFLGIMTNEIGAVTNNNHIPVVDPEKIRGVCMDLKALPVMGLG